MIIVSFHIKIRSIENFGKAKTTKFVLKKKKNEKTTTL